MSSVSPQLNIAVVTFPTLLNWGTYYIWFTVPNMILSKGPIVHCSTSYRGRKQKPSKSYWLRKKKKRKKKVNLNSQICPNLNREEKQTKSGMIAFLVSFSIVVFFFFVFIYQMYVFWCWRFSVLLDLYCLVKCSYNHSLMWTDPALCSLEFLCFSCSDESQLRPAGSRGGHIHLF